MSLSPAELAETVRARQQDRLGLTEPPGAAIEITAFRPIYVLGAVGEPGPLRLRAGPDRAALGAAIRAAGRCRRSASP